MSDFCKGDRVVLYSGDGREIVTVVDLACDSNGCISVIALGQGKFRAHPKQLRKLKKPREYFVLMNKSGKATLAHDTGGTFYLPEGYTAVRVREVKS